MFQIVPASKHPFITVPDVPAAALIVDAICALKLQNVIDPRFLRWDFDHEMSTREEIPGRGLTYEVVHLMTASRGGGRILSDDAEAALAKNGAYGHVGAFLSWLMVAQPIEGTYLTLPPRKHCFHLGRESFLYVPCAEARHGEGISELGVRWTGEESNDRYQYLGFRPVVKSGRLPQETPSSR